MCRIEPWYFWSRELPVSFHGFYTWGLAEELATSRESEFEDVEGNGRVCNELNITKQNLWTQPNSRRWQYDTNEDGG